MHVIQFNTGPTYEWAIEYCLRQQNQIKAPAYLLNFLHFHFSLSVEKSSSISPGEQNFSRTWLVSCTSRNYKRRFVVASIFGQLELPFDSFVANGAAKEHSNSLFTCTSFWYRLLIEPRTTLHEIPTLMLLFSILFVPIQKRTILPIYYDAYRNKNFLI